MQLGDAGAEASHQTPQRATERAGQGAAGSGAGARVPDHAPERAGGAAQAVAGGGDQLAGGGARHDAYRCAQIDVLAERLRARSGTRGTRGTRALRVRARTRARARIGTRGKENAFSFLASRSFEELGERSPREVG